MRASILLLVSSLMLSGAAASAETWAELPDWSGDWVVVRGKADLPPPYRAEWSARLRASSQGLRSGKLSDPRTTCGIPAGAPRMMGLSGVHEWIVRPDQVWHAVEDGNTVQRIYTDGRPHRQGDDLFATYTGDNVGRWDGQTLVIDTVGLRSDTWLDDAAGPHSDQTHMVARLRREGAELVARIEIDDPVAFTHSWKLERRYRRLPAGSFVHDFACKVVRTARDAETAN